VLSGGCAAADALYWGLGLVGFGIVSDPQSWPDRSDPAPCVEPYMAKRADGTEVLAYRPKPYQPGCHSPETMPRQ